MRSVVIEGLRALVDTQSPQRWKGREWEFFDIVDDLDHLTGSGQGEPGDVLATPQEAHAARSFADALDGVFRGAGTQPSVDEIVENEAWPRVVRDARLLLERMSS